MFSLPSGDRRGTQSVTLGSVCITSVLPFQLIHFFFFWCLQVIRRSTLRPVSSRYSRQGLGDEGQRPRVPCGLLYLRLLWNRPTTGPTIPHERRTCLLSASLRIAVQLQRVLRWGQTGGSLQDRGLPDAVLQ
jgi:hypothetical protein